MPIYYQCQISVYIYNIYILLKGSQEWDVGPCGATLIPPLRHDEKAAFVNPHRRVRHVVPAENLSGELLETLEVGEGSSTPIVGLFVQSVV